MTILVSANRTSRAFFFFIQKSFALKNKTELSTQLPYFDICVFDDERNERIDGRFVPMTDSEFDNLIETEGNSHTKKERFVQEIVVPVLQRYLQYTINRTCPPLDKNFNLLVFKSIFHLFAALQHL